jgi:hypothetical protein
MDGGNMARMDDANGIFAYFFHRCNGFSRPSEYIWAEGKELSDEPLLTKRNRIPFPSKNFCKIFICTGGFRTFNLDFGTN